MGGGSSTINVGQRVAVWDTQGNVRIIDGPATFYRFGSRVDYLTRYVASPRQYAVINFKDGHVEHKKGPITLFNDPIDHVHVAVKDAIEIKDNEVLVVCKDGLDGKPSQRRQLQGPSLFFPEPDERFEKPLQVFIATQQQYLIVMFLDGKKLHLKGPCKQYLNPSEHSSIIVKQAINVEASQVIVVFREQKDGAIKRELMHGPILFFPQENEWTGDHLTRFIADEQQYLIIKFKDGHKEHKKGPTTTFLDPVIHNSIEVCSAISVNESEVLVVYRESNGGKITRYVVRGPTIHVPQADEWVHGFCWHGQDPREPNNECKKVPGSLKFTKLRIIPDQFYYNVTDVRTSDDTLLTCKLMIFFELVDLEKMLNQTHDPIADFINSVSADVIAFTSQLPYEIFLEKTALLSSLDTYPLLAGRAKKIGYAVTKVVFRGYHATEKLQAMHDDAIQTRTHLRLQSETEEQAQQLADLKLLKEGQRTAKRHEMEKREQEHKNSVARKDHEEKMIQKIKEHDEDIRHLEKIKSLGVDLTKYMTAKFQNPEKLIQIKSDDKSGGNSKFVFHHDA